MIQRLTGSERHAIRKHLQRTRGKKCAHPCCHKNGITIDHIVPLALGGNHSYDNLQLLCQRHNQEKDTRIIDYAYFIGRLGNRATACAFLMKHGIKI